METLQLQLGDIIQLEAPSNDIYHDKTYLITYIDTSQLDIQEIVTLKKSTLLIDEEGLLNEESIESISLLSRSDEEGYAKQNKLLPNSWISITFGGDIPAIIFGEITNLEEDMIEIKTYPENDIIYLDFAYKGIPKSLPIDKIEIKEPPALDILETEKDIEQISTPEPEVKKEIQDLIISADDIQFGSDLGEITQQVIVDETYERYGIQSQTNDLLDELLSSIPTHKRSNKILNNIHLIIERFKQLRTSFSNIDENGIPRMPLIKTASHKPLVKALKEFNKKINWILPVAKNKKILYDIDLEELDYRDDIVAMTMAESNVNDGESINNYNTNSISDSENKYNYLLTSIQENNKVFEQPENKDDIIISKNVKANLNVIIDNLDNFESSIVGTSDKLNTLLGNSFPLTKKRYLIETYNLGLTKLDTYFEKGISKPQFKRVPATNSDKVFLKSLIILPEKAVRYSRATLPTSNIMQKAILSKEGYDYYKKFNNNTTIDTQIIEDFNEKNDELNTSFLTNIVNIEMDDSLISEDNSYEKYLNSIIPKTRVLFNLMKKYIENKYTLSEIVKELEPFLIYSDDLTYKQYVEMNKFIKDKISEYKKEYIKKNREFRLLSTGKKYADRTYYSLFSILKENKKTIFNDIYNLDNKDFTSSENYAKIMNIDNGRLLMTSIALENLMLMTPVDINEIMSRDYLNLHDNKISEKNTCINYVLAKRYIELDELLDDNDKEIYYDKTLDQTRYDIIDEYKEERESMESEEFYEFLVNKLIENIGLSREVANIDADSMINGKRKVQEGDYASLEIDNGEKYYYYKRVEDKWDRDESLPETKLNNEAFCNLQQSCLKINTECLDEKAGENITKEHLLENIIKEFDTNYEVSKEELERLIQNRFEYYKKQIKNYNFINDKKKYLYNDTKLKLIEVTKDEEEIVVSPYLKLMNLILGQYDLTKKNNDIIKFKNMFLRNGGDDEDNHWLYCNKTNTKLLPTFLYTLATTFVYNSYDYVRVLDEICANQGEISDDGDSWVDKYSGYVIKKISYNTEEGYDESGYRIESREVMRENLTQIRSDQIENKYSDPNAIMINNIVSSMGSYMGIFTEPLEEFIIRNTLLTNKKIVPSESEFNKKREVLIKKGKKVPTYEDTFNTSLLLLTLSYYHIAIQIAIPSIKTKKQFPGCKKAFDGFPLDGSSEEGIIYISCVANKIKSSVKPWNTLSKLSIAGITKRIKELITKYIVNDKVIQIKLSEKIEYLQTVDESEIPSDLDISKWNTFLPPLVMNKITSMPESVDSIVEKIKEGKNISFKEINTINTVLIKYSQIMINNIQKLVSKETMLLTNNNFEPFLENSCCIDDDNKATIQYFKEKIPDLEKYNKMVETLHKLKLFLRDVETASKLHSPNSTKLIYPDFNNDFSEKIIYKIFIHYCNFGNEIAIPEELQAICLSKPNDFSIFDSLDQQIEMLKSQGKNFELEDAKKILEIIGKKNIVNIKLYHEEKSALEKLREFLKIENNIIPHELREKITSLVDTFDLSVKSETSEMKSLINYLDDTNNNLKMEIILFLQKNTKLSKKKFETTIEFIRNLKWKELKSEDDSNKTNIIFMTSCINLLTKIFPNIVLNELDYDEVNLPKYWNLSQKHYSDIRNIINNYYSSLSNFYGNEVLSPLLKHVTSKSKILDLFLSKLPIFEKINNFVVLNTNIVNDIVEFIFLSSIKLIIDESSKETLQVVIKTPSTLEMQTKTTEEIANEITGDITELDIVAGENMDQNQIISEFLLNVIQIFANSKKLINYTYDDIIYRINVSKEKEKDQITRRLKELSDEEREIENMLKGHKLGDWSKGLAKGVTQYVKDNYDNEREEMEKTIALERKVGTQDYVSSMNRDIYMMDAQQEQITAEQIENEEMMINYQGEDADFEDLGMDGDEMY